MSGRRQWWLATWPVVGRAVPVPLVVGGVVVTAGVLGGPVAGVVAGVYAALAAAAAIRRRDERDRAGRRGELLDALGVAAAELRAGVPVGSALRDLAIARDTAGPAAHHAALLASRDTADGLAVRVRAAVLLADLTGAPVADLIERIEADARAADRSSATAAAQAAGARVTVWLLAGLPAGGVALGYAIGTDPLAVLLHTPIGAACALGALLLQLAGLAWTGRISRVHPAVAS